MYGVSAFVAALLLSAAAPLATRAPQTVPVDRAGTVTTIQTGTLLSGPDGATFDAAGRLLVANWSGGKGTTLVRIGDGVRDTLVTGLAAPDGVAFGPDGSLYISNFGDGTVVRIGADGSRRVHARDLGHPSGLAFLPGGDLLVADFGNYDGKRVWRVDAAGNARVFAEGFAAPIGLFVARDGSVFVSNFGSGEISRIATDRSVHLFARVPNTPAAMLQYLAADDEGNLYVPSFGHNRVYRIDRAGGVHVAAGRGVAGGRDGSPDEAEFDGPNSIARAADGSFWITEYTANRLRRITLR